VYSQFASLLRGLVLPFGAIAGTRIVLDGVNGRISLFDASSTEIVRQDAATGTITAGSMGTGPRAVLDGANAVMGVYNGSASVAIEADSGTFSLPTITFPRNGKVPWINSYSEGDIEVSSEATGTYRSRLALQSNLGVFQFLRTSDSAVVSEVAVDANGVSIAGGLFLKTGYTAISSSTQPDTLTIETGSSGVTTNATGDGGVATNLSAITNVVAWNGNSVSRGNLVVGRNTTTTGGTFNVRVHNAATNTPYVGTLTVEWFAIGTH
jgi:hypothetical protein